MEALSLIKEIGKDLNTALSILEKEDNQRYYSFELDCDSLRDYNNVDIRYSIEFSEIFQRLNELDGPVLYWFDITSKTDSQLIRSKIKAYSELSNSKATPALKKEFDQNSTCLYVGKVKKRFFGRIIQHLGFFKQEKTQGLQLFYWAKGIGLKLQVNAISFDASMSDLISILELEMSRKLNPIIGKHK